MYLQNACMWRYALVKRSALVPHRRFSVTDHKKTHGLTAPSHTYEYRVRECVDCAIKGDGISAHHARSCAPQSRASDVDIARMAPRRPDAENQRRSVRAYGGVCVRGPFWLCVAEKGIATPTHLGWQPHWLRHMVEFCTEHVSTLKPHSHS